MPADESCGELDLAAWWAAVRAGAGDVGVRPYAARMTTLIGTYEQVPPEGYTGADSDPKLEARVGDAAGTSYQDAYDRLRDAAPAGYRLIWVRSKSASTTPEG